MGHGSNKNDAAGREIAMGFAKGPKSVHENFFQLPQLTVLHPYDDGAIAVTCRGEDGREQLCISIAYSQRVCIVFVLCVFSSMVGSSSIV